MSGRIGHSPWVTLNSPTCKVKIFFITRARKVVTFHPRNRSENGQFRTNVRASRLRPRESHSASPRVPHSFWSLLTLTLARNYPFSTLFLGWNVSTSLRTRNKNIRTSLGTKVGHHRRVIFTQRDCLHSASPRENNPATWKSLVGNGLLSSLVM